jgi:hypothetical protein
MTDYTYPSRLRIAAQMRLGFTAHPDSGGYRVQCVNDDPWMTPKEFAAVKEMLNGAKTGEVEATAGSSVSPPAVAGPAPSTGLTAFLEDASTRPQTRAREAGERG